MKHGILAQARQRSFFYTVVRLACQMETHSAVHFNEFTASSNTGQSVFGPCFLRQTTLTVTICVVMQSNESTGDTCTCLSAQTLTSLNVGCHRPLMRPDNPHIDEKEINGAMSEHTGHVFSDFTRPNLLLVSNSHTEHI